MTGTSADGGPFEDGGRFEYRLSPAGEVSLSHLDQAGHARMVDVSGKDVTARQARASGRVLLSPRAIAALRAGEVPKGDALAVARIAGIQGAKKTPDLIPLCHPIGLHAVSVELSVEDDGVAITAMARTADRTGVEMEALTSVTGRAGADRHDQGGGPGGGDHDAGRGEDQAAGGCGAGHEAVVGRRS
jgi:cyclic pyranopterin phosphate synthase